MGKEGTVEASSSSGSPAECTTCLGLLYLSSASARRRGNGSPNCFGYSRRVNVIVKEDKSRQEVAKHGEALRNFKYACMGRSMYRSQQPYTGSIRPSDLPSCDGLEIFGEGSSSEATDAASQRQLKQMKQRSNEGAPVLPRPPTRIEPPAYNGKGLPPDEFDARFIRSAGKVAVAVKDNVLHLGNHFKSLVKNIFHSGDSGSK